MEFGEFVAKLIELIKQNMLSTDYISLWVIHIVLFYFFIRSLIEKVRVELRKRHGGIQLTVKRGERSMTFLYVSYGVVTIVYSLAIDVSQCAVGHKTTLIVLDYIVITYLFFFNSWFRNSIVLRTLTRLEKD